YPIKDEAQCGQAEPAPETTPAHAPADRSRKRAFTIPGAGCASMVASSIISPWLACSADIHAIKALNDTASSVTCAPALPAGSMRVILERTLFVDADCSIVRFSGPVTLVARARIAAT